MLSLYFVLALLIGALICYEDLKYGLIRNRYIILLLILFLARLIVHPDFLDWQLLEYIFWTIFTGVFFYFIDIWPAGDAKLFISLSLLFPWEIMETSTIFNFLINSFVPLFFAFVPIAIYRSGWKKVKKTFKISFSAYNIFLIGSMYVGVVWFLTLPMILLGIQPNIFVIIILLFVVFEILGRIKKINMEYLYVFLIILRIVLDYYDVLTFNFLKNTILIIIIFIFFRFFILRLTFDMSVKKVRIKDLKPGMEVAEGIKKKGKNEFSKIKLIQLSFYDFLSQKKEKLIHSKVLTKKDVETIKKLRKEGKIPFGSILIHQPILFGIFIYLGYILTFILKTSFIYALSI